MISSNSSSIQQNDRVEAIAAAIADQLACLFPDGYSIDDNDDDEKRRKLQGYLQNLAINDQKDLSHNNALFDPDELKSAIPLAVKMWKDLQEQAALQGTSGTSAATTTVAKSFSLLDQFNSGGFGLMPMVDLDDLLVEASTIPEQQQRLEKLQKIHYLDDILPVWKQVQGMLYSGLENRNSLGDDIIVAKKEYLRLARKWFHEARTSSEYLGIQYDICNTVSKYIAQLIEESGKNARDDEWTFDVLKNWHDMFLDLMQRNQYVEELMNDVESTFWQCLTQPTASPPSTTEGQNTAAFGISVPHIMALIDPQAHCFASWIHHISPTNLVNLLEKTPQVVTLLVERASNTESSSKIDTVLCWYSLSVLTFVLLKTRVALFPWQLLIRGSPNETNHVDDSDGESRATAIELLLDVFCGGLLDETSRIGPVWRRSVCCNGIEAILSGSCRDCREAFASKIVVKAKTALAALKSDGGNNRAAVEQLEEIIQTVTEH